MFYTPHKLQVCKTEESVFSDDGIPDAKYEWIDFANCRCDDNSAMKQVGINGILYTYSYHIVYCGGKLLPGTKVRVLNHDGFLRGEVTVVKFRECNLLKYAEIWV